MKNEPPFSPIGESLTELLTRLKTTLCLTEEESPACAHLVAEESECIGTYHLAQGNRESRLGMTRLCPEEKRRQIRSRITEEKRQLWPLLYKCGVREEGERAMAGSVSRALFAAIDQQRPVKNLDRLLAVTREACKEHPPQRNLAFLGSSGLCKTTCQLIIHFARLEAGINSYFVDSIQLRDLFRRLHSFNEEVAREAQRHMQPWLSADSMVWSDAGDTQSHRATEFAESLCMLLERSSACWVISSNLSVEELKQHADIGPRAVSRLLAAREGHPAGIVGVGGEDQRLFHALPTKPPGSIELTEAIKTQNLKIRSWGGEK